MSEHPCKKSEGGKPCRRIRLGQPYDIAVDCRLCWLFAHDERYNLAWGGDGKVSPVGGDVVTHVSPLAATLQKPRGFQLGDAIEKALEKTGIKQRVEKRLGRLCGGCEKRKRWLNALSTWAARVLARGKSQ